MTTYRILSRSTVKELEKDAQVLTWWWAPQGNPFYDDGEAKWHWVFVGEPREEVPRSKWPFES